MPATATVIDGSQVLAQSIVAATRSCTGKVVRSAHAVFVAAGHGRQPIELAVEVVREGRTVAVGAGGRHAGRPHEGRRARAARRAPARRRAPLRPGRRQVGPDEAIPLHMPVDGREIRLVGVADPNDPDHVGPPVLDAWLRYDDPPQRDDLVRALLAHFTGHLSISTSLFPHPGLGTAQAHRTLSTGVMTIGDRLPRAGQRRRWLLYRHESTQVGAGMSYVRGQVVGEGGALVASFTQEGLIRAFVPEAGAEQIPEAARL